MLRYRLEKFCEVNRLIRPEQASGQSGARTSDHLLVLHHLIQKYVKNDNKILYVCNFANWNLFSIQLESSCTAKGL